jgi:hypothetical protein
MTNSILNSTKKMIGLTEDYTAFDLDIQILINSALASLQQLGVGPETGFAITGESETWDNLLGGDARLNTVQNYVFLKVRLAFDPPQNSYLVTALEKQLDELSFRINVAREREIYVSPEIVMEDEELVLDGGTP